MCSKRCATCNEKIDDQYYHRSCLSCCADSKLAKVCAAQDMPQSRICPDCNVSRAELYFQDNGSEADAGICKICRLKRPLNETERACQRCFCVRACSEYGKRTKNKDGLSPICLPCMRIGDTQRDKSKKAATFKRYYYNNLEKENERARAWHRNNPEKSKESKSAYKKTPESKLRHRVAQHIRDRILKDRTIGTMKYLGCNIQFFKSWIESQFDEMMSWQNMGQYWHLDHVTPCASFNLQDPEQIKHCFSWENMQPLEASKNMEKSDKIWPDMIAKHKEIVQTYKEKLESVPSITGNGCVAEKKALWYGNNRSS